MIQFIIILFILNIISVVVVHKIYSKEYHLIELVGQGIIPIIVSIGVFLISEESRYYDTEYLGEVTRKVIHEEDYEYWTTCSETYPCGTDDKGNTEYCTRYYPCCEDVPNKYYAITTYNTRSINSDDYYYIKNKFGNEQVIGVQGNCRSGNILMAKWDGDTSKFHPLTIKSSYKNKVRFSSVYKTRTLTDKEKVGMLGYPKIKVGMIQDAIVGKDNGVSLGFDVSDIENANRKLSNFNSIYGEKSRDEHGQVRVFVFIYKEDDKARNHIHYIGGVNKNELMVVIGPNFYEVYAFDNESITNYIRTILFGRNYTMTELVNNIISSTKESWVRKEFTQLNRVINVEPSSGSYIFGYIINIILNIILTIVFTKNELKYDDRL